MQVGAYMQQTWLCVQLININQYMREYIYIIVFTIGLIWTVYQRYRFETMTNKSKDKDYCKLYRENNNTYLIIFIALVIDKILQLN